MNIKNKKNKVNKGRKDTNRTNIALRHKLIRRFFCLVLSFSMLLTSTGIYGFYGLVDVKKILEVQAYYKYDVADYTTDSTIEIDGVSHPYYELTSQTALILYSQAYYEYPGHENDVIKIDLGEGTVTSPLSGFESIGNDTCPFYGRVYIGSSSYTTFNLECPFFGTVYDSVQVYEDGTTTPKNLTITRISDAIDEPLFVRKVLHDDTASVTAEWHVTTEAYTDGTNIDTYPFAGFIGELCENAEVAITAINNSVKSGGTANIASSSNNIGLLCQTIGYNAYLSATYSGINTDFSISTTSGHAGGLVGYMGAGSGLNVDINDNPQITGNTISTGDGYAGGVVGCNDGGTVIINLPDSIDSETGDSISTPYRIDQNITGTTGAGNVYGYYRPAFINNESFFDINDYTYEATLTATGSVGGLFGMLENESSNGVEDVITISTSGDTDTVEPTNGSTGHSNYGGLIGEYKADETTDTLVITGIKTDVTNNASVTNYGGAIGMVDSGSYVLFDDYILENSTGIGLSTFGGLVANADGAYIYAKNVTIGSSAISGFTGGGLIGSLGNGVLGMTGTIDLTNAQPNAAINNGQIVGTRDNALVYAENIPASGDDAAVNWSYSPSSVEIDNIGSWGDVVLFDGTNLKKEDVFSTETNHVITLNNVDTSDIDSVADYALVSILFQINPATNSFLSGTQLSEDVSLEFTDDIDLSGTGLRGITRDNGSRITYSGTITGNNHSIAFDIKNLGGSNRQVYYHARNGLIGNATNSTVTNLYLEGNIIVKPKTTDVHIGAFAAESQGTLTADGCKTLSSLNINVTSGSSYVAGRFVGNANSMNTIGISRCEFDGFIRGSGDNPVGGVIGKLGVANNISPDWVFDNISLKGSVSGVKSVGGLVAEVSGGNRATVKLVGDGAGAIGVVADGITVSGNSSSMGGLLGYNWLNTDVEVSNVSIANSPEIKYTGTGGTAGLVYCATGHWTVTNLDLSGIKVTASSAKNIGMIVNRGTEGTKNGIYLELPSGYNYSLSFDGDSDMSAITVFDELCAYSADSAANIMTNKQGIVSISTSGLKMEATAEDSLSYKNQTTQGATANPNTRYYYNLDLIDDDADISSSPASQLMRWGVYQYACDNIRKYFDSRSFAFASGNSYDMKGYSWYPVTPRESVSVAGTFKFYNKEFTDCEEEKSTNNKWLPNATSSTNQHYMMQNGLFYDINSDLTIGTVVLQGTIGATGVNGTGALIYGTVKGTSPAQSDITKIDSTNGNISLDGVKIWNFSTVSSSYAPLLINKTGSFVNLQISNVSTTSTYGVGDVAGTSLIGRAGGDDDTYVNVDFTQIKLDARTGAGTPALSNHGYSTTKSIFTRATLLERLVGESGTYTYSFADDWGAGNHNVTYGEEVGYSSTGQYPAQEQWYARGSGDTQYATSYSAAPSDNTVTDTGFGSFLPYVGTVSTTEDITVGTGKYYQLKVNHQPTEKIKGCGTYNDPYIIETEADLAKISRWIAGQDLTSATINAEFNNSWCDGKSEHKEYSGTTGSFVSSDSSTTKTNEEMRHYLCEAYYKISPLSGNSITITSSNFRGLGTKDNGYRFRGVIVGGNNISITNKTAFPLIAYSEGSVVKNLTIYADSRGLNSSNNTYKDKIVLYGKDSAYDSYDSSTNSNKINAYGAVFGQIVGGDNIIDNVQLNLDNLKLYLENYSQYVPVGGYVGVVINGGVVFRNMSGSISGLTNNSNIIAKNDTSISNTTDLLNSDNYTWLFVNPIIGRVINGYAVTESSTGYKPREANVTMKNSTGDHTIVKNYSITDIATSGSVLTVNSSAKTIAVPDSQAFVLMSYMVNSGMAYNLLGYQKISGSNYFMRRHAAYDDVGSIAASSNACSDYNNDAKNDSLSSTPYLIYKYTGGGSAPIGSDSWTVNLETNGNYDLSDGFRGIGNFFNDDDKLRLNITAFNGNGSTINQNTSYYYYAHQNLFNDAANDYLPANSENSGIGLFNCLNTNGSFNNFILTGSVKCDAISRKNDTTNNVSSGDHIFYKTEWTNQDKDNKKENRHLSAAMLLATVKSGNYPSIDSVALQNINVRGVRNTGGLIGNLIKSGNKKVIITNNESYDSYGIVVHGAGSTAGLIGRNQEGVVQVDLNNCHFNITEIVSECSFRADNAANGSNTSRSDYNYGVGGFIGICRTGGTPTVSNIIERVKIGTKIRLRI